MTLRAITSGCGRLAIRLARPREKMTEELPPQSAKPDDHNGFRGKSDFFRAVNHSSARKRYIPLPPFALSALPSRRLATRTGRVALYDRDPLIQRSRDSTKRFTMVLWSFAPCPYELELAIRLTPLPIRPSSSASSRRSRHIFLFFSPASRAPYDAARCVNRWPPHSSMTNVIPDSKCH